MLAPLGMMLTVADIGVYALVSGIQFVMVVWMVLFLARKFGVNIDVKIKLQARETTKRRRGKNE
jgi:hypothetical protein